ncbi:MAG: hypothetical protein ACRCV0_04645 [Brevinema sp.]
MIIDKKYISFSENQGHLIVMVSPNQELRIIDRKQNSFINLDKFVDLIEDIKNNQWDSFILSAIKELG